MYAASVVALPNFNRRAALEQLPVEVLGKLAGALSLADLVALGEGSRSLRAALGVSLALRRQIAGEDGPLARLRQMACPTALWSLAKRQASLVARLREVPRWLPQLPPYAKATLSESGRYLIYERPGSGVEAVDLLVPEQAPSVLASPQVSHRKLRSLERYTQTNYHTLQLFDRRGWLWAKTYSSTELWVVGDASCPRVKFPREGHNASVGGSGALLVLHDRDANKVTWYLTEHLARGLVKPLGTETHIVAAASAASANRLALLSSLVIANDETFFDLDTLDYRRQSSCLPDPKRRFFHLRLFSLDEKEHSEMQRLTYLGPTSFGDGELLASADGRRVVWRDQKVWAWPLVNWDERTPSRVGTWYYDLYKCRLSPDGNWLVATSTDSELALHDLRDARCRGVFVTDNYTDFWLDCFSQDGCQWMGNQWRISLSEMPTQLDIEHGPAREGSAVANTDLPHDQAHRVFFEHGLAFLPPEHGGALEPSILHEPVCDADELFLRDSPAGQPETTIAPDCAWGVVHSVKTAVAFATAGGAVYRHQLHRMLQQDITGSEEEDSETISSCE